MVGHDWGAAVAWLLAAIRPERVERLVAMSVGHPATARRTFADREKAWYMLLFQFEGIAEELLSRDDWASSARGSVRTAMSSATSPTCRGRAR